MINRNSGPYACWNNGYPVPHQTGQGNSGVEGCYIWNNNAGIAFGPSQYAGDECGHGYVVTNYVQLRRDYFTIAKPGYVKYTYPHPLRSSQPPPTQTASAALSSPHHFYKRKKNAKNLKRKGWGKARKNPTSEVADPQEELGR